MSQYEEAQYKIMLVISRMSPYEETPNQVTMPKTRAEEKSVRADFVVDDAVIEVRANCWKMMPSLMVCHFIPVFIHHFTIEM